jgi:hypothetical protein
MKGGRCFSSMETDRLSCGLDHKMFTRKTLSLHVSAQVAILKCYNCWGNCYPVIAMVAVFKTDSRSFQYRYSTSHKHSGREETSLTSTYILSRIPRMCASVTNNSTTRVRIGYRIYSLWRFIATADYNYWQNKQTPWPLVRERTIPTDRPPLVDEI